MTNLNKTHSAILLVRCDRGCRLQNRSQCGDRTGTKDADGHCWHPTTACGHHHAPKPTAADTAENCEIKASLALTLDRGPGGAWEKQKIVPVAAKRRLPWVRRRKSASRANERIICLPGLRKGNHGASQTNIWQKFGVKPAIRSSQVTSDRRVSLTLRLSVFFPPHTERPTGEPPATPCSLSVAT